MRLTGIIIILFLTTIGCKNPDAITKTEEINHLSRKISELQRQNKILRDSLSEYEENFLYSQTLVGVPDKPFLKVGKNNNIVMLFQTFDKKLPKYDIYKLEGDKQIKIGSNTSTRFEYNFTPKSIDDKELKLLVKIPYNKKTIEIPSLMIFDVKE